MSRSQNGVSLLNFIRFDAVCQGAMFTIRGNNALGDVFTKLHFLHNLRTNPISLCMCTCQAFPA